MRAHLKRTPMITMLLAVFAVPDAPAAAATAAHLLHSNQDRFQMHSNQEGDTQLAWLAIGEAAQATSLPPEFWTSFVAGGEQTAAPPGIMGISTDIDNHGNSPAIFGHGAEPNRSSAGSASQPVPGPGAIALLMLAAFAGRRRRS